MTHNKSMKEAFAHAYERYNVKIYEKMLSESLPILMRILKSENRKMITIPEDKEERRAFLLEMTRRKVGNT